MFPAESLIDAGYKELITQLPYELKYYAGQLTYMTFSSLLRNLNGCPDSSSLNTHTDK